MKRLLLKVGMYKQDLAKTALLDEVMSDLLKKHETLNVHLNMTHPYSIYIWQPPHSPTGIGHWDEPVQCFTEQWATYIAGLIHQDSRSVIKVVRYGINIACFPDERAVELVERQIAKQKQQEQRDDEE